MHQQQMESYLGQQQRCHKVCDPRDGGHFQVPAPHTKIGSVQECSHLLNNCESHKFTISFRFRVKMQKFKVKITLALITGTNEAIIV